MAVRLDHLSLAVSDLDAAITFFCEGLGFITHFIERGMTGQIASMLGLPEAGCDIAQLVCGGGDVRLELIAFRHEQVGRTLSHPMTPGMGHVAFRVDQFEATLARLYVLGAEQLGAITQFEAGKAVYLRTPFHAFLEVQEASRPESAAIAGGNA
ncbi:VOC family protein [Pseudaminobacter sp. 19-2017]|uniref:VOC family protein n=1 Tax=Pseudaminobacter soli (ex Zhang et al. 2022) TaxID=2831468 RepID=A0A942I2W5_9HYPH|nr:VOC family protein [Pseudaminobacter soli]MBS3649383.1 VOC family protein [Pseudaminobacter soli]